MSVVKVTADDKKHEGDVTCVVYHNGFLFSAGSDGKVKIWDSELNFKKELAIHEAHIYAIDVDQKGCLYTSSCDGTIKHLAQPLESDDYTLVLQHPNEIEAVFVDENSKFYCGDDHGGVTCFEDGKLKYTLNIVEGVKSLFVEKDLCYTLLNLDLSVHEIRDNGKYCMKISIPGKFPVTLFGDKTDGRSKYIAILTRDGKGVTIVGNRAEDNYKTITVKENLHQLIVNALKGTKDFLFSCDYGGKVIRTQVCANELKQLGIAETGSGCANCLAVFSENSVFVGSSDGSVKKIVFN